MRNLPVFAGAILIGQRALFAPVPYRTYCSNDPTNSSD